MPELLDRQEAGNLFTSYQPPGIPVVGPNDRIDIPKLQGTRPGAATYVAWDLEYEGEPEQITFESFMHEGVCSVWFWTELDRGDSRLKQLWDDLETAVAAATPSTGFEWDEPYEGSVLVDKTLGQFYGREMRIPFTRIWEKAA